MQPFTRHTPKALIPLLGVPCMEYSIALLEDVGIREAVVNVHAHPNQLRNFLENYTQSHSFQFKISDESNLLLGSAGGLRQALPLLGHSLQESSPFFSLNADVISLVDLQKLAQCHQELKNRNDVVMTLCLSRNSSLSGQGAYTEILTDESTGLIQGIGSKKPGVPFFTGTAVYETEAFWHLSADQPSEFVPDVLTHWISQGRVGFYWMDDLWLDIGSPELWFQSHWILDEKWKERNVPLSWSERIERSRSRFYFSKEQSWIDYDDATGKSASGLTRGIVFQKERYVS